MPIPHRSGRTGNGEIDPVHSQRSSGGIVHGWAEAMRYRPAYQANQLRLTVDSLFDIHYPLCGLWTIYNAGLAIDRLLIEVRIGDFYFSC